MNGHGGGGGGDHDDGGDGHDPSSFCALPLLCDLSILFVSLFWM